MRRLLNQEEVEVYSHFKNPKIPFNSFLDVGYSVKFYKENHNPHLKIIRPNNSVSYIVYKETTQATIFPFNIPSKGFSCGYKGFLTLEEALIVPLGELKLINQRDNNIRHEVGIKEIPTHVFRREDIFTKTKIARESRENQ
jgi:hypothetical protein